MRRCFRGGRAAFGLFVFGSIVASNGVLVGTATSAPPPCEVEIRVRLAADRGRPVVKRIALEDYVAGALAGEIPASWDREALRAQAVASRSYALHQRAANARAPFDVESTTTSQVYRPGRVSPSIRAAVRDTGCEVLTHGGAPILAAFHSASGGRTATAQEVWGRPMPYLVSQDVADEDDSPDTYWRVRYTRNSLGRALAAAGHRVGPVEQVEILQRSASDRVLRIRLRGEAGEATLSGRELRSALGDSTLRSTMFQFSQAPDAFVFVGSGSGHGVGMSQWGARALAEHGTEYREILQHFYPGALLKRLPSRVKAGKSADVGDSRSKENKKEEERRVAMQPGDQR